MADITLYVNGTDNAASHYFVSMAAALAHGLSDHADLTAYGHLNVEISITTAEPSTVTVGAFTTDATHRLKIYTTAEARHAGEWSASKYRLTTLPATGYGSLELNRLALFADVTGLQVGLTLPSDGNTYAAINAAQGGTFVFDSCLIQMDTEAGSDAKGKAFSLGPYTAGTATVRNCAVRFTTARTGCFGVEEDFSSGAGTTVYNCTFKKCAYALVQHTGTMAATNCGYVDCTAVKSGTVTETTCSSTTPTFAAGTEFHLDTTDTTWKDQGTDLSGTFTTDIDGATRTGTWDIGCDELSSTNQFARPSADRTDGNWLNSAGTPDNVNLYSYIDETSYSDSDYIQSGAAPSSDTCVIDLSSIATPQAGTVTLRVRAKYV